ncbi:hypothetical protein J6590_090725, partial [Homalodisca vitripennis]
MFSHTDRQNLASLRRLSCHLLLVEYESLFRLVSDLRYRRRRVTGTAVIAWLLLGWVNAERSCPREQPTCPAVRGDLE